MRALLLILFLAATAGAQRQRLNFNPGWLVQVGDTPGAQAPAFDDHAWKHITTPYAWNEDSAFKVSIHDLPTGIAWYRKHFQIPAEALHGKVFIEFEGIRQAGDVYLNGEFIGRHEDGVMAFGFDLTAHLKPAPADNVLAVKTDNSWDYREQATNTKYEWNNTNFYANYGGISKSVWLYETGLVFQTLPLYAGLGTTGQYIYASDFDLPAHTATLHAESQFTNSSAAPAHITYNVEIMDMAGKTVASFPGTPADAAPGTTATVTAQARVPDLHFWSWGYGYLYNVVTTLSVDGHPVDTVTTRTGFRSTSFANGQVTLNGRVIQMHGYAQRTTNEWPSIGLSVPAWMSDYSNRQMVDGGANLVRWMHVTPWKQDVESSDRVGLIESMPAGDAEGDPKGRQWTQRVELMRDAIIYNRNNPSILFYESGNKGISDTPEAPHMADMLAVKARYDPHGGRAIGAREMLASKNAEYGGEMLYLNKSATKPVWAHEYSRDESARKFQDDFTPPFHPDAPDYNRDGDSQTLEDVRRWYDYYAARPGSGTRVSSGGVNIIYSDSNTHYRGDNNYRRSGEVDALRIPKDAWYAHQAMWDGWVDPEHPHTHLVGHWNYAAGTTKPVYVVSNAKKVELLLNGKSLGFGKQSSRFLFTFDKVTYTPGTLKAVGYNSESRQVSFDEKATTGLPAALRLTAMTATGGLKADGHDLALVEIEVVDKDGSRVPTALNMIGYKLTGPAEWRGGIAQGSSVPVPLNPPSGANPTPLLHQDNYILATSFPVEGGVNRMMVRSTPKAGVITLTASSPGLKDAVLTLSSQPIPVIGGIATFIPSEGLSSNLSRGETPSTPSYHQFRHELYVAAATAGSNAAEARLSLDDNEMTAWVSDGSATGAWIEYTLKSPAVVGEIDLKLNSFRTRRYRLSVTVDGHEVYRGLTPTSLGYATLRLKPATGSKVRITLVAPPESAGKTEAEVNGKIDNAGIGPVREGKMVFPIIEAEVYGPRDVNSDEP